MVDVRRLEAVTEALHFHEIGLRTEHDAKHPPSRPGHDAAGSETTTTRPGRPQAHRASLSQRTLAPKLDSSWATAAAKSLSSGHTFASSVTSSTSASGAIRMEGMEDIWTMADRSRSLLTAIEETPYLVLPGIELRESCLRELCTADRLGIVGPHLEQGAHIGLLQFRFQLSNVGRHVLGVIGRQEQLPMAPARSVTSTQPASASRLRQSASPAPGLRNAHTLATSSHTAELMRFLFLSQRRHGNHLSS